MIESVEESDGFVLGNFREASELVHSQVASRPEVASEVS